MRHGMRPVATVCMYVGVVVAVAHAAQSQKPRPATPVNAVDAVMDAFRSHAIVALGEGKHGNEQGYRFRLSLVHDPRFPQVVNDIVVESGNALYQDVMDRFVRGEDVPDDVLRRVWRNTTQPHQVWDRAIYEEFFRAVRAVNRSLLPERRLRVLLGDPPVDWDRVTDPREVWDKWMPLRDSHPAELIHREVIAKGRRALVVYGDAHVFHKSVLTPSGSLVARLERDTGTKVFSIRTAASEFDRLEAIQPDVSSWSVPALAVIQGTVLGRASFTSYGPPGTPDLPLEELYDAVLYVGASQTITLGPFPASLCADQAYLAMRSWRTGDREWGRRFQASCTAGR
jgi:hypothetical protein